MLTNCDTWYGKHRFVPFDDTNEKDNIVNILYYKKNRKVIKNILLKNIHMEKYPKKSLDIAKKEYPNEKITLTYNIIDEIVKLYENKSLNCFMNHFSRSYNINCIILYYLINELIIGLELYNMNGMIYWKQL